MIKPLVLIAAALVIGACEPGSRSLQCIQDMPGLVLDSDSRPTRPEINETCACVQAKYELSRASLEPVAKWGVGAKYEALHSAAQQCGPLPLKLQYMLNDQLEQIEGASGPQS